MKKQIQLAFNIITLFNVLEHCCLPHFTAFVLKKDMADYKFLADGRRKKKEKVNIVSTSLNNDLCCWGKN